MLKKKHKIVIIGCGNLAWHLAKQINKYNLFDIFIYNHQANPNLNEFKSKLNCHTEIGFKNLIRDANYYFICVSDDYISSVSKIISPIYSSSIVLHCSGSLPLSEIKTKNINKGVFYPLQTFSKADEIDWQQLPILLESSDASTKKKLDVFTKNFSKNASHVDYKLRLKIHLAAVLVNNFTNSLFLAASDLISETSNNQNFKIFLPLIKKTFKKLEKLNFRESQTGPAKRKDYLVIKKHLKVLEQNKDLKKIYKQLTKLIIKQQK